MADLSPDLTADSASLKYQILGRPFGRISAPSMMSSSTACSLPAEAQLLCLKADPGDAHVILLGISCILVYDL